MIDQLGPGGAQQWLVDMLPALRALGWPGSVLALHDGGLPSLVDAGSDEWTEPRAGLRGYPGQLASLGFPVARLAGSRFTAVFSAFRLARFLRKYKPEVLHLHLKGAWMVGLLAARISRFRAVLVHDQSGPEMQRFHPFLWNVGGKSGTRWLLRRARFVVAVSPWVADFDRREFSVPDFRSVLLANGIPVEECIVNAIPAISRTEWGFRNEDYMLVGVGRLIERKGFDVALRVLSEWQGCRRAVLLLLGDGEDRYRLEKLVKKCGIQDRVHFAGHRIDVPQCLAGGDVFIFPSLYEPFGTVAVEAMAAGLPVVGSRTGGIAWSVADGETGLLFPVGDVNACRHALERLAADEGLRHRMGCAGRERARKHFDRDKLAVILSDWYRFLLLSE